MRSYRLNSSCNCGGACCSKIGNTQQAHEVPGTIFGGVGQWLNDIGCPISCNLSFIGNPTARLACLQSCNAPDTVINQSGNGNNGLFGTGIDITTAALVIGGVYLISKM